MDQGRINLDWCLSLLQGLAGAGLRRVVISPGSRNTPLTLATVLHPRIKHDTVVDERSAAFFALGIARETAEPVALVCTSGSAVANWLPAVVEANRQQLPLILLSADRPWELQRCQANQTIDQIHLFGNQVRAFHQLPPAEASESGLRRLQSLGRELIREASMPRGGPVHVNLPLREPLVPRELPQSLPAANAEKPMSPQLGLSEEAVRMLAASLTAEQGIIVCGPCADCLAVLELAARLDCPVLADPLSGLRFASKASSVIVHYDLFLRAASQRKALSAGWVLQFGGTPVSKALQEYLNAQLAVPHWWIDASGRNMDRPNVQVETLQVSPQVVCGQLLSMDLRPSARGWQSKWLELDKQVEQRMQQQVLPLEAKIIRCVLEAVPAQSLLFSGNSMVVRFLDAFSGGLNKEISVRGNRGASGIDGNLSTFAGIASAFQGSGKVVGIVGDLTLFHDLNALSLAREQDMTLVLLNNNGGGIFDHLPQHDLPAYEACWRTPVELDHEHIAAAFGIAFSRVENETAFADALSRALSQPGMQLIEVLIDSACSNERYRNIMGQWAN